MLLINVFILNYFLIMAKTTMNYIFISLLIDLVTVAPRTVLAMFIVIICHISLHVATCRTHASVINAAPLTFWTMCPQDQLGLVICPRLRSFVCRKCGASGPFAHTDKHCLKKSVLPIGHGRRPSPTRPRRMAPLSWRRTRSFTGWYS